MPTRKVTAPLPAADEFTATAWDTGAQKRAKLLALTRFLDADCALKFWTPGVYHTLSQHLFGHIAEFNAHGFYSSWFSDWQQRLAWVENALAAPCYGDPTHTWCDAERFLQTWLVESGLRERWRTLAAREARGRVLDTAAAALQALSPEDRQAVLEQFGGSGPGREESGGLTRRSAPE